MYPRVKIVQIYIYIHVHLDVITWRSINLQNHQGLFRYIAQMLYTTNYSTKAADEMVEQEFTKARVIFLKKPPNSFKG